MKQSTTQTITPKNLPAVNWDGKRVITTELLARLYGTDAGNVQKNYERNQDRFQSGRHFVKLEGEPLRQFKKSQTDFKTVSGKARSLMLWTERGAARHAKMLETDAAWEVFEELEDFYFSAKSKAAAVDSGLSTVRDRLPLYLFVAHTVVERQQRLTFRAPAWHTGLASKEVVLENTVVASGQTAPSVRFCHARFSGQMGKRATCAARLATCFQHLAHPSLENGGGLFKSQLGA